ncbi:hypothetical protein M430DRAFT_104959 [Amorphotheca resinae ATCC 22711]|uniref:AAA+ ATPase domain-containing protein n=1 Tax=Amorphotheca resinae ATCC 22711 TaxID=857342 RepID=A0A2T3AXN0_AMORE|nr:hypothetical protein M430DRAFT_104959 [Amorphotheca resinae ATCC 22711]PSS14810.1 hypothetical protein M430DRAFT_104959 [Amorphotheca resinae ATCC 22711]
MPAISRSIRLPSPSKQLLIQLSLSRHLSSTASLRSPRDTQTWRSDFSQGYTGSYEPGAPTVGPLAQTSELGVPRLTPSMLKEHLDKFVVGQDKAKKVTSVAIYNHYQRTRELRRQEAEEAERRAQRERRLLAERERDSHPVENEFPGHVETVDLNYRPPDPLPDEEPELGSVPLSTHLSDETIIEKSNLLLLGPSGVGKTYILSTLARVLEVPFATVDCSALTQAGYIGTDIESSIERLLLASGNSVSKCETGIIFFDEVDKLAKPAVMTHGRDVSGEGVQQGLLKMIEGTTVTVTSKSDRSSRNEPTSSSSSRGLDRMERGGRGSGGQQPGKAEQYTIDTSNILFVFAGAFVGLEKIINSRLSSGSSIGFGASLKNPPQKSAGPAPNPLDSIIPSDLQNYGLIPELLGRIPIITALHPLTLPHLVSILTEPRNSLVKQYTALFKTYGIQLRFSTPALHAIAARALAPSTSHPDTQSTGIGARGLRAIMESVLAEIMFWGPGSAIKFCLVDEAFVNATLSSSPHSSSSSSSPQSSSTQDSDIQDKDSKPLMPPCWSRGQNRLFEEAWEAEEERWRRRHDNEKQGQVDEIQSFERLREAGRSGM